MDGDDTMKVLVAEDSPSMLKIVVTMLHSMGYDDVVEFPNGSKAWDHVRDNKVEFLLTDCNMPMMSGLELTQKVRSQYSSAELPVLMFTTLNSKEDILAAVRAGVNGYIVKPFNQLKLKGQIEKILTWQEGGSLQDWVQKISAGNHRPSIQDTSPLVIMGEKVSAPSELGKPDNKEYTRVLSGVIDSIGQLNEEFDGLHMSYYLDSDSNDLVRQIRHHRNRLKLLLVSSEIGGGGVTMARLARINQSTPMAVGLLLHAIHEIPRKERDGLQKAGVLLLERHQLNRNFLKQLFREHVVAQVHETLVEKPTAEQIAERVETDISLMTSLPVLPVVYHRIMKLSRYRDSAMQEWVAAVETDPLSSAMIIRRANSPIYGFKAKVNDAAKAVNLLGKSTVKELIVSDTLRRSFATTQEKNFHLEDYWLHSLATGMIARILHFPSDRSQLDAEQKKDFESWELSDATISTLEALGLDRKFALAEEEDPFVGGMMHDLGKVALVYCYPGLFPAIVDGLEKVGWKAPMGKAEETVAGIDHTQVGQILARSWGLDESLGRVVAQHHAPAEEDRFSQLVALASFFAGVVYPYPKNAGYPPIQAMQEMVSEGGQTLGIDLDDEDQVKAVRAFLPGEWVEKSGMEFDKLLALGMQLCPDIEKLVEKIRSSMQD